MSANNPLSNIPQLGTGTGMMPAGGSGRFQQVDPLRVIRSHLLLLIAALVVGVVVGAGSWFALDRYVARYTSDAALGVTLPMVNDNVISPQDEAMRILEPRILTEVNVIKSQETLDLLLRQPEVRETDWYAQFNDKMDKARLDLEEGTLGINHIRNTTLIRISASTKNPTDAQTLVRNLYEVYLRQVENRAASQYNTDRIAYQQKLESVQSQIRDVEASMRRHQIEHPRSSGDDRTSVLVQELLYINSKKSEIAELLSAAQASYQQLKQRVESGDFEPSDDEVQYIQSQPAVQQIDAQLRQLRVSRQTQLDKGLLESHPLVQQIDSQILHTEREREMELDHQARMLYNAKVELGAQSIAVYEEQLRTYEPRIMELQAQLEDMQRAMTEFETMQRELEYLEVQREDARVQLTALDTIINREGSVTVKLRNPATTAEKSFPPKWYVMIPGVTVLFFGLVLGLVFLRELLDQRIKAAADIKSLPDAALLGIIPDAGEDPSGKAPAERVVERQPTGLLAESFRQVRSAVLSKMDRRGYKTLAVAAAKPKAGASSIVQNLGASMARSGRRVLIIDANFRRPSQAALNNAPGGMGLVELLRGEAGLDRADNYIHQLDGMTLSVLPAGDVSNAAPELLETSVFRDLLARLESSYDIVLIDTPPSLLTSEAQLMCKYVDAMLLVARARIDTRGMMQRLIGQLDGQRADILGIVLNGVQASAGGYLRQNFQEFHRYRSESGGKRGRSKTASMPAAGAANGATNGSSAAPPKSERAEDETVIVDALQDLDELDDMDEFDKDPS